jgi:hypothetical protein
MLGTPLRGGVRGVGRVTGASLPPYETNERLGNIVLHNIRLFESHASNAEDITALL